MRPSPYLSNWPLNKVCSTHKGGEIPNLKLKTDKYGQAHVFVFSDVHIGQESHNRELFEKHLQLAEDLDAYIVLAGDILEFAVPTHIPEAMFEQSLQTNEQVNAALDYLMPYRDKILFMVNGNHELRSWKKTGIDISQFIARDLGTFYNSFGGYLRLSVGDEEYTMATFHGYSGGQVNIWGELERMWGVYNDAEIVTGGHIHHLAYKAIPKRRINAQGSLERKYVHFVRTGSYVTDAGYGMRAMYSPTLDGSPIITLSGKEHNIAVDVSGETRWAT